MKKESLQQSNSQQSAGQPAEQTSPVMALPITDLSTTNLSTKPLPKMTLQQFALELVERHGLDSLIRPFSLSLGQEGLMPLHISSYEDEMHVSLYNEIVDEDEVAITFLEFGGQWVPVSFSHRLHGTAQYHIPGYSLGRAGSKDLVLQPKGAPAIPRNRREVAAFCARWADDLQGQGWLEKGQVSWKAGGGLDDEVES